MKFVITDTRPVLFYWLPRWKFTTMPACVCRYGLDPDHSLYVWWLHWQLHWMW